MEFNIYFATTYQRWNAIVMADSLNSALQKAELKAHSYAIHLNAIVYYSVAQSEIGTQSVSPMDVCPASIA